MKAIVLKVKPYSFLNEQTGQQISGTSVQYITKDNEGNFLIGKTNAGVGGQSRFKDVPGLYELTFDFYPNSKGQLKEQFRDAKYIDKAAINL